MNKEIRNFMIISLASAVLLTGFCIWNHSLLDNSFNEYYQAHATGE